MFFEQITQSLAHRNTWIASNMFHFVIALSVQYFSLGARVIDALGRVACRNMRVAKANTLEGSVQKGRAALFGGDHGLGSSHRGETARCRTNTNTSRTSSK